MFEMEGINTVYIKQTRWSIGNYFLQSKADKIFEAKPSVIIIFNSNIERECEMHIPRFNTMMGLLSRKIFTKSLLH